ncbi:MAG: hypothetical protein ACTSRG_01275 [Candidatus Helarchaeota archaeon]
MYYDKNEMLKAVQQCLRSGDGNGFVELFNSISKEKMKIDFQKIKNVKEQIAGLLVAVLQNSIQTSNFSVFFQILDVANKFDLFKYSKKEGLEIKNNESKISESLILENLKDLFGNFSSDFYIFIKYELPRYVLRLIANIAPPYLEDLYDKERIEEVKMYVEFNFYLYGFRVRKVSLFDNYLKNYKKYKMPYEKDYYSLVIKEKSFLTSSRYFFDVLSSVQETHLIRKDVFEEIVEKYNKEKMIFGYPCISMVVSGGIGPQGKGFAYLTPKNEVIEVCSDAAQNKAYIIEFKKFLKSIFLSKLDEKLQEQKIFENLRVEIIQTLDSLLEVDIISSEHINFIWDKIEDYFIKKIKKSSTTEDLVSFLKKSIYNILVPVRIEDQFKTRMNLITESKLDPTDISKLVSLGNISHFDILCQRRFFLNLLENMLETYQNGL